MVIVCASVRNELANMMIQETRRRNLARLIETRYDTLTALAASAGKSSAQLSGVMTHARSFGEKLARSIEQALDLPDGWLDQRDPVNEIPSGRTPDPSLVPIRRVRYRLSAGVLGFAVDFEGEDAEPLFFRSEWFAKKRVKPEMLVALKVSGGSMEPTLFDGDTIVINREDRTPASGVVFAINFEGECVVKRLRRDALGWWLTSDNSDKRRFADIQANVDQGTVLGRVIYRSSESL
jgi:phage repressor protein C with HTH and peptisase S24 domain